MKKRKFGLLITSVLATGAVLAACGDDEKESSSTGNGGDDFKVGMVTDTGGVDDKSFNQSAWEGIQEFGKDNSLTEGEGYTYLASKSDADYKSNLDSLIRRDFDLVFGIGFLMADAIGEAAEENPDDQFAIVDDEAVQKDNLVNIMFKEQEGAYLAGVAAAKMSKSGKIGFVGGMDIPVIHRFHAGFVAGATAANPDIEIMVNYVGDFSKADLGKIAANTMYSSGADIIFHAAGASGNGVFAEAIERKSKDANADVWVIGVDRDQYAEGQVDSSTNVTLTSMIKRVDAAVIDVAKRTKDGKFPGGEIIRYGLAEEGVGLADSRGVISDDILKEIKEYQEKIISGEIKVSADKPAN
jgi:basic membrane protein A and related proteins